MEGCFQTLTPNSGALSEQQVQEPEEDSKTDDGEGNAIEVLRVMARPHGCAPHEIVFS